MTEHDPFLRELQHRADRAHQSANRADDAPPDLWQRVRSQVKTTEEESPAMSTVTMPVSPVTTPQLLAPERSGGFGHYANLAVTITLVLAVAVAGWFATMQLNQSGNDNDQFAFAPGTPEVAAATCDVEPMTVDQAMSVAKNPLGYMAPNAEFMEMEEFLMYGVLVKSDGSQPGYVPPLTMVTDVTLEPVNDDEFAAATVATQDFLNCIAHGTVGQVWQFVDPVILHYEIHSEFPMFTSEDEARAILAELLVSPAKSTWDGGVVNPLQDDGSVSINPNQELAYVVHQPPGGSFHITDVVFAPLIYVRDDGTVAMEATVSGFPLEVDGLRLNDARNVIVGQSMVDGSWYVLGLVYPGAPVPN